MKIVKPDWISHEGVPIHSVDISKDGTRLATGGLDTKIRLWDMKPLRRSQLSPSTCLAELTDHTGGVNCVRWAPRHNILASCSDDHYIFLWQALDAAVDEDDIGTFGQTAGAEAWKAIRTLRGHQAEVNSLAWSPDGSMLASSSVDTHVLVWNTTSGKVIKQLTNHGNHVKGVAFDPMGLYLASQGDDRAVRIFNTSNWEPAAVITDPFQKTSVKSLFLRLSWSTDGLNLVAMHAANDAFPVSTVIDRKELRRSMDFVGHTGPPIASRSYPHLVKANGSDDPSSVMAIGGEDGALSIWVTGKKYPLAAIQQLFLKSVVDCTWNPNGALELIACSLDGSVAYIRFNPKEFGMVFTETQAKKLFLKLYGQSKNNMATIVSSAAAYSLLNPKVPMSQSMDVSADKGDKDDSDTLGQPVVRRLQPTSLNTSSSLSSNQQASSVRTVPARRIVPVQQAESRTKEGKRRIMPSTTAQTNGSTSTIPSPKRANRPSLEGNVAAGLAPAPFRKLPQLHQLPAAAAKDEFHLRLKDRVLQVTNNYDEHAGHHLALIRCLLDQTNEAVHWRIALNSSCTCMAADDRVVAIATKDGLVHVINVSQGDRLLPPFTVGRNVALLKVVDGCLFVVTSDARLNVWRVEDSLSLQALHSDRDLSSVLAGRGKDALADVGLLPGDHLAVYVQDSKRLTSVFSWDTTLHLWSQLASHKAVAALGAVAKPVDALSSSKPSVLRVLRRMQTAGQPLVAESLAQTAGLKPVTKPLLKLDSCQQMLVTARRLEDAASFEALLVLYARVLAEEKQAEQLRRVCKGLLGLPPVSEADLRLVTCPGVDPKQLLRKVLTMLTTQSAHYGKLVDEFVERLNEE
eukprot:m.79231 g.79231  ORF g.79231 m.79231 type:complete len:856 (-) comp14511_c0_seq7:831-3398(-)